MADENPLGPQPNFNLISDELKKAQNLPAITNGQQILDELREIRQDIANTRRDLGQDIANTRRDLGQDIVNIRRDLGQDIANTRRDLISMMTASYV